ncbi:hypothetical protein MUK72_19635 (plasmid) [Halococcus dombrowskii]|nr:hypothetical protein [Halococcus dombrowskii]UOO97559.1 hypothetical protein MUK72_19635 [Halococcus dombrowskii]
MSHERYWNGDHERKDTRRANHNSDLATTEYRREAEKHTEREDSQNSTTDLQPPNRILKTVRSVIT